jgi:CRP-like cAMP-binding protein
MSVRSPASDDRNLRPAAGIPSVLTSAGENAVLAALPAAVLSRLQKHLRWRNFTEGVVLWDVGEAPAQICFPRSGMISIRVPTSNGHGIEVANIGREGAAGFPREHGLMRTITQAVVQGTGQFACIAADHFAQLAREHETLTTLARCCDDWLLLQAQQIAACNTVHAADARFCRWLLRASEAIADDMVCATQEAIAEALGVRRTTATLIARRLQSIGAISYSRGKIAIRDRARLAATACDCHAALGWRSWPAEFMRVPAEDSSP